MSIELVNAVFAGSSATRGNLLVLLALAERANDDGIAFPGIDDTAERTHLTPRQVQRAIRALVAAGELELIRPGGGQAPGGYYRGATAVYRVIPRPPRPPRERKPRHQCQGMTGGNGDTHVTLSPPYPDISSAHTLTCAASYPDTHVTRTSYRTSNEPSLSLPLPSVERESSSQTGKDADAERQRVVDGLKRLRIGTSVTLARLGWVTPALVEALTWHAADGSSTPGALVKIARDQGACADLLRRFQTYKASCERAEREEQREREEYRAEQQRRHASRRLDSADR